MEWSLKEKQTTKHLPQFDQSMVDFQDFSYWCGTFIANIIVIQAEMRWMKSKQSRNHTYFSEVKVWLSFKASPIDTAPWVPILLSLKLDRGVIHKSNRNTHSNEIKGWFTFNASPIDAAPSSPILLSNKLKGDVNKIQTIKKSHLLQWSQIFV